jgi:hypothetical protein
MLITNTLLLLLMAIVVSHGFVSFILKMKYFMFLRFFMHISRPNFRPKSKSFVLTMGVSVCLIYFRTSYIIMALSLNGLIFSTPQQNRVAKRKNRHLIDVVRTLLLKSFTPSYFWCEALSTTVHLINRLSSPTLNHDTPLIRLFGHPPTYSNLRTFGYVCYIHLLAHERTKLTA